MRISDWSSDVCSSDLDKVLARGRFADAALEVLHGHDDGAFGRQFAHLDAERFANRDQILDRVISAPVGGRFRRRKPFAGLGLGQGFGRPAKKLRSEEHTSELQSLMRISYAVFCLKKKNIHKYRHNTIYTTTQ